MANNVGKAVWLDHLRRSGGGDRGRVQRAQRYRGPVRRRHGRGAGQGRALRIDLTAWGWFWLIVGVAQIVTGVLILQRNAWGLWLGVGFAGLSAMLTVIVMFVFPLWAIAVMAIDFLVLFALLTQSDEFLA